MHPPTGHQQQPAAHWSIRDEHRAWKQCASLAHMIVGRRGAPATLSYRLQELESSLASATSVPDVLDIVGRYQAGSG